MFFWGLGRAGCGPAVLLNHISIITDDGCISKCPTPPLNAYLISNSQCQWLCAAGYALVSSQCLRCSPSLCVAGEFFYAAICPHAQYCIPCQPIGAGVEVDMQLSSHGVCVFKCMSGWVKTQQTSTLLTCTECAMATTLTCPPSQYKICSVNSICAPCGGPSLSAGTMAVASTDSTCRIACASGFAAADSRSLALLPQQLLGYNKVNPCITPL